MNSTTLRTMHDIFRCFYCGAVFQSLEELDKHVLEHEIIYVPIAKSDLNRLVNFMMTKDEKLITENLSKTLFRYFRHGG